MKKQTPESLALWMDDNQGHERKWTYSEMQKESVRTARFLTINLGASNSTHTPFVLTILGRVPEWWFFHLGCIRTGHIFCPGTIQLSPGDISYRLEASGANMIVTDESNIGKVDEAVGILKDVKIKKELKKVVVTSSDTKGFPEDWIPYAPKTNQEDRLGEFKNKSTRSKDIAVCFFTSGTTGQPKLVGHTHASVGIGNVTTVKYVIN